MTADVLSQETYLPEDGGRLAQVYDLMRAHEAAGRGRPEPRYLLIGSAPGEQVELPAAVYQVLRQVVEAMAANLAVTVSPHARTLTTQQAADLLGVSRPTLVKVLEAGKVPFERVGAHRRILLRDLLDYRDRRRGEQYAALAATSVDLDDEDDVHTVLADLRAARHEIARRRRTGSG